MRKHILAAALLAPVVAFAPASAMAHHCKSYHKHHASKAEKGAFGSGKSMQKDNMGTSGSQGSQDLNKNQDKGTSRGSSGTTY
ncbi:MAG: hypothetical protein ACR652_12425 [Methylocystis sp.]|uniref:hypothetical protein n=1 Tax=Methylocystis sp. TaxID=1911079 RepID=UPI003DA331B2